MNDLRKTLARLDELRAAFLQSKDEGDAAFHLERFRSVLSGEWEDVIRPALAAAISYVDIKTNHPQIAGEAWRDLVAAINAIEAKGADDETKV